MGELQQFFWTFLHTITDVLPIAGIIFGFQFFVIRKKIPNLKRVLTGFFYVVLGLALFLQGLEDALFPIGKMMAAQLTAPEFINQPIFSMGAGVVESAEAMTHNIEAHWSQYFWVYVFAFTIGFSTTVAEPSLLAVAIKANEVSGGTIGIWGLRISVAIGVAFGISLGSWRIVTGLPLHWFIISGYIIVVIQTFYSPKLIIPLAYDSGGVTTSTVTVPIVAALGIGLAANVPGRSQLLDGFGLIAFASLFPIISVLAYAQLSEWYGKRKIKEK
ncbi:MAG: DUF1538 domain-containing protein [gamma proteobacterium symbiont of Lucinoma myriamae]|nr:DUF1538 domain-containing protein [gamma proteobacterium symbiont of Lucinoma myriamae]MCU7819721.1 DUF1538 domain-containing protein [gamma proteobacterium symbiont of Lucinoma myriamae]MCU7833510.1 DUF1538 domain-containing protein [gamma proteobacterium symbiont of Lucinoma myriamae]